MMSTRTITLIAVLALAGPAAGQPRIIFDTDFGGDADDLGALVMLHEFASRGEVDLLAVATWQTETYTVPALDAINRFYGHPHIPIGARRGEPYHEDWMYSKPIADAFHHEMTQEDAADAVALYRKHLASSEDSSVVIVTVGPLANIKNLIESEADSVSDLAGRDLINRKVREFVIMGGRFPEGEDEWNFNGNMPGVTKFVLENLDVPITFSGFEIGDIIKTGEVFNDIDRETPLYVGFRHFSEHAWWMKDRFKGSILDNATYDQTAVLYAVRGGVGEWWDRVEGGYCQPDSTGGNVWVEGPVSNHAYLKLKVEQEEMAGLIESLMLGEF